MGKEDAASEGEAKTGRKREKKQGERKSENGTKDEQAEEEGRF